MPIAEDFGPTTTRDAGLPPGAARSGARSFKPLPAPPLEWNSEVEAATAHLYDKVKAVVPPVEWPPR